LPEKGISLDEILDRFQRDIAPYSNAGAQPKVLRQFNPTPAADWRLADALVFDAQSERGRVAQRADVSDDLKPALFDGSVSAWVWVSEFGTLASGGSEANLMR